MTAPAIHRYLSESAARAPGAIAVDELGGRSITYGALDRLSDRLAAALHDVGVGRGDRVGLCVPKSADAIAAIYGVLKAGAAYVPLDGAAPAARNAYILRNCDVRALVLDEQAEGMLRPELEASGSVPPTLVLPSVGGGDGLVAALEARGVAADASPVGPDVGPDDIAYILYTSGSTGQPKGVTLTHGNGISFVDWCSEMFAPTASDRFSLFPPLQFDMSTSDLFLSIKHGATIVPIDDHTAKNPFALVEVIEAKRLTMWISVPSILAVMARYGHMERRDLSSLRILLFAGEVFPVAHLRRLREQLPRVRMFNLYGPTETNVCTWFEIPEQIPASRTLPYPIGRPCGHARARVVDAELREVESGGEGELCIAGEGVMRGYWNAPELTRDAFFEADSERWYRTGDIVREEDGELVFLGRRDRMVKRHGYRIELGEIEAALYTHPAFRDVAVLPFCDADGIRLFAAYATVDGAPIPLVELKSISTVLLPLYMVPDRFRHVDPMPRTRTGKTDYQRLKELF